MSSSVKRFSLIVVIVAVSLSCVIPGSLDEEKALVAGNVWEDLNHNGVWDDNEPGKEGVVVHVFARLETRTGQLGELKAVGERITIGSGYYQFTLGEDDSGSYHVVFEAPPGYGFTQEVAGENHLVSHANPASGETVPRIVDESATDSDAYAILNAGLVRLNTATIANYAWLDANGDGVQDDTEEGLLGVTVTLFVFPDEEVDFVEVASTTSDLHGFYEFANVEITGDYFLRFQREGYVPTLVDRTSDDLDNDADPITGETEVFSLEGGTRDDSWDAGFVEVSEDQTETTGEEAEDGTGEEEGSVTDEDPSETSGETSTPEGFTVNWTIRQEGDDLIVTYRVTDAEGNPVTGTGFATIVIKDGNPGGSGARHKNGSFDEKGVVELILELIHPPDTEIDAWLFFEEMQNALLFTSFTLGQ